MLNKLPIIEDEFLLGVFLKLMDFKMAALACGYPSNSHLQLFVFIFVRSTLLLTFSTS